MKNIARREPNITLFTEKTPIFVTGRDKPLNADITIMSDKEIREYLLPYVFRAALAGGAAIMENYNSDEDVEVSLKSDRTPITIADRAAHNAIKEVLGPTRIPIMSEEGREMEYDERRNWELFWLVDPLDGTVEFINKSNEFTVNIALVYKNEVIAGVIYVPYFKKLFYAMKDLGAYVCEEVGFDAEQISVEAIKRDSVRLPRVSEPRAVQRVVVSRSHTTDETLEHIGKLRESYPDINILQQGSSYKFCILADGEVDYYVRMTNTYEWDTAAGEIILSEAGGKTAILGGDDALSYNKELPQTPYFYCRSAISKL